MEKQRYKGILYIICSAFCFALMNMFVRAAGDLPSIQKSFFRNLVAFVFAMIILKKNDIPFRCKRENLKYLLIRSICGTLGILCNYYAVDHLVLSDASMLNKMSPFFAVIFSCLVLKEKVNVPQALFVKMCIRDRPARTTASEESRSLRLAARKSSGTEIRKC